MPLARYTSSAICLPLKGRWPITVRLVNLTLLGEGPEFPPYFFRRCFAVLPDAFDFPAVFFFVIPTTLAELDRLARLDVLAVFVAVPLFVLEFTLPLASPAVLLTAEAAFFKGCFPSADELPTKAPVTPPISAPMGPPRTPPTTAPPIPPAVCFEISGRFLLDALVRLFDIGIFSVSWTGRIAKTLLRQP